MVDSIFHVYPCLILSHPFTFFWGFPTLGYFYASPLCFLSFYPHFLELAVILSSSWKWFFFLIFSSFSPEFIWSVFVSHLSLFSFHFFLSCYSFYFRFVFEFLIQSVLSRVKIHLMIFNECWDVFLVFLCFIVVFLVVWEVRNVFAMWKTLIFTFNLPLKVAVWVLSDIFYSILNVLDFPEP